ncbi:MAG: MFS transporter [Polyangiaceae bacterium]|nr:MFS transporter [Polyangiaceae bacterium]
MNAAERSGHPRAAFAHRDFRLYMLARFLAVVGVQVQSVAVGWQVYSLTRDPLHLGWVGLAQFLPLMAFALPSGHVADRFERRRILMFCLSVTALAALGLAGASRATPRLWLWYALLVVIGTARAFYGPAASALLPSLVPKSDFANAVAWSSTNWQVATICGPALGGAIYGALGPEAAYATTALFVLGSVACLAALRARPLPAPAGASSLSTLLGGIRYVWREKTLLGAITLDLFAVLLGGAVALLPALAKDVLHVGPGGLGVLRGAPAVGAALMALGLAHRPLRRHAGPVMLASVGVFGLATVVLGLSRSFLVSLSALVVLGASDMISVFVRQNLVQLGTPDAMRGRVSAVNLVFIGASNELGELESGVTAAWLGVVPAVVAGGIGTVLVVGLSVLLFPALRRVDRLADLHARG